MKKLIVSTLVLVVVGSSAMAGKEKCPGVNEKAKKWFKQQARESRGDKD